MVELDTWSPRIRRLQGAPDRVERLLRPLATEILQAANPLVPFETGRLRRSGTVVIVDEGAAVSYGRTEAPYASVVYNRRRPPVTGQRKWLAPARLKQAAQRMRAVRNAVV